MGKHFSHLTPTQRTQIDAFRRAGMKVVDIAKEVGAHYTTIYRELKRCTYEHLNSDYTTEIRYNPDGAQARYEANLRAKGPELKIGNDYELADYLIGKIRDEKHSPEAAIGEAEVMGWPFRVHICASTAYNYIRAEIFGDDVLPVRDPRKEFFLGAVLPCAVHGVFGERGDLVIAVDAAEMIDTDDIVQEERALEPLFPPTEALLFVRSPIVDGIAPKLTRLGKVIGRDPRDLDGPELFI